MFYEVQDVYDWGFSLYKISDPTIQQYIVIDPNFDDYIRAVELVNIIDRGRNFKLRDCTVKSIDFLFRDFYPKREIESDQDGEYDFEKDLNFQDACDYIYHSNNGSTER